MKLLRLKDSLKDTMSSESYKELNETVQHTNMEIMAVSISGMSKDLESAANNYPTGREDFFSIKKHVEEENIEGVLKTVLPHFLKPVDDIPIPVELALGMMVSLLQTNLEFFELDKGGSGKEVEDILDAL